MCPCGDYSNHCNKSGYYSDYAAPFPHVNNCVGKSWTNTNDYGGSYHVNLGPGAGDVRGWAMHLNLFRQHAIALVFLVTMGAMFWLICCILFDILER